VNYSSRSFEIFDNWEGIGPLSLLNERALENFEFFVRRKEKNGCEKEK